MNKSLQHPDEQKLERFVKDNSAAIDIEIADHLIECKICRQRVDLIASIPEAVAMMHHASVDIDEMLDNLEDDKTPGEKKDSIVKEIKQNSDQLRSALHTLTHRASMNKELADNSSLDMNLSSSSFSDLASVAETPQPDRSTATSNNVIGNWRDVIEQWWLSVNLNRMILVPAVVMALLVSILLSNSDPNVTQFQEMSGLAIISQDSQLPGIGFFNNANIKQQKYSGIQVEMKNTDSVRLTWPAISGAKHYKIKLQRFINGQSETLKQLETTKTSLDIELSKPFTNVRFEWTLSGDKTDKTAFMTRGGFIIDQ